MITGLQPLSSPSFHSLRLFAMNTPVELMVFTDPEGAGEISRFSSDWLRSVEHRFSRFREESELSQLNRLAGQRCLVSYAMLEVLHLAEMYRMQTEGIFDPLLMNPLEKMGYDISFEEMGKRPVGIPEEASYRWDKAAVLQTDPRMKSVILPAGKRLDLGGLVKSWAVHRLAGHLRRTRGIPQGLVNAGGDLTVWGRNTPGLDPWLIGIENPWQPEADIGTLALGEGSCATSSTLGRRWKTDDGERHHLVDPRTGRSSDSGAVQCTVAGPDVKECEIWAKTLCILGADKGTELLRRKTDEYEAVLFGEDRTVVYCGAEESLNTRWLELTADRYIFHPKPDYKEA